MLCSTSKTISTQEEMILSSDTLTLPVEKLCIPMITHTQITSKASNHYKIIISSQQAMMATFVSLTSEYIRRHKSNSNIHSNCKVWHYFLPSLPLYHAEETKYSFGTFVQESSYFQPATIRRQWVQCKSSTMVLASLLPLLINTLKSINPTPSS